MADAADYRDVPFQEAIDFLREKTNVTSPMWTDLLGGQHAAAFTVAGAVKDGMLTDFRSAIDDAIANGTTIADFRKRFDDIVTQYGWDYNGGRGWRTRVIYQTNLSTAYSAGRYRQMTDPDVLRYQPYWRYRHADGVKHPRPQHLAWDGLTLRADDPWWREHHPPNGWGCHCYVEPLSRRELADAGKTGPDTAPATTYRQVMLNTSNGPLSIKVPNGIDPGWGYNVGDAKWGEGARGAGADPGYGTRQPAEAMAAAIANRGKWQILTPGDWRSYGRPAELPVDMPKARLGPPTATREELRLAIERAIGGKAVAMALPDGSTVLIDAAALADHIALDRGAFVPFLPELIADPAEMWRTEERHRDNPDLLAIRTRLIKVIDLGSRQGLVLVLDASGGMLREWTFVRSEGVNYAQNQRVGKLVWARRG